MRSLACAALWFAGAVGVAMATRGGSDSPQRPATPFTGVLDEHPAIRYAARPTDDRVARLARAIADGKVSLPFQGPGGYLRPVLDALGVPAESQLLVFSRTGVQRAATGPRNPRAIFFNDSVAVGFIPGARFLELAAHDPEQGVVFYMLDQSPAVPPAFRRRTECLSCHVSSSTLEVPGMINHSVFVATDGAVMRQLGTFAVDHRTRLLDRWGGMYVTGDYAAPPYGRVAHMGNVTVTASRHAPTSAATRSNEVFIEWLNSAPETRGYPSAESDIASLMIFDHQVHAVNLLTRLNWEARVAASEGRGHVVEGKVRELVDDLTDYFLFVDEEPPPVRLTPRAGFAGSFTAAGPRDRRGRSLRDLDLDARLMRYPCSYMIDSDAFTRLPPGVRTAAYERIWSVLSGRDNRARYAHLSPADRQAILEILRDTRSDWPESFR